MNKKGYILIGLILLTTKVWSQDLSKLNKNTSWFLTNECFSGQLDIESSDLAGFNTDLSPISSIPKEDWYGPSNGMYLSCDLDNDGRLNYFGNYTYTVWPSHHKDIFVHSRDGLSTSDYSAFRSLGHNRKFLISDLNNDNNKEVVILSHGYDAPPFPGDSIGIYHLDKDSIQYLSSKVAFFHGGAIGDINNDSLPDIILGQPDLIYLNQGDFNFKPSTDIITNTNNSDINWVSVEVFDLNNDNSLEIITTSHKDIFNQSIEILPQNNNKYDYQDRISIPLGNIQIMDFDFLDFNNDGLIDLLVQGIIEGSGGYEGFVVRMFLNDGNLNFIQADEFINYSHYEEGSWYMWNFLYDFDNDGDVDIVPTGLPYWWNKEDQIFFSNNGSNNFSRAYSKYRFTNVDGFSSVGKLTSSNYPNPFNPSTTISVELPSPSRLTISIYDYLGREISKQRTNLINDSSFSFSFNGSNYPSGVYYYRVETSYGVIVNSMTLIK